MYRVIHTLGHAVSFVCGVRVWRSEDSFNVIAQMFLAFCRGSFSLEPGLSHISPLVRLWDYRCKPASRFRSAYFRRNCFAHCTIVPAPMLLRAHFLSSFKNIITGLERWLSSWRHRLLFQRTRIWFPAPTSGDSQMPVTDTSSRRVKNSGLCGHLHPQHH